MAVLVVLQAEKLAVVLIEHSITLILLYCFQVLKQLFIYCSKQSYCAMEVVILIFLDLHILYVTDME